MIRRICILVSVAVTLFVVACSQTSSEQTQSSIDELDNISQKESEILQMMEDYDKKSDNIDEGYGKNKDETLKSDESTLKDESKLSLFDESTAHSLRKTEEQRPTQTSWLTYNVETGEYEEAFYDIDYTREGTPIYHYAYSFRGNDKKTKYVSMLVPQDMIDAKYVLIPHDVEVTQEMKDYFDEKGIAWIQTNEFTDTSLMEDGRTYLQTIIDDTIEGVMRAQSSLAKIDTQVVAKYLRNDNAKVSERWLENQKAIAQSLTEAEALNPVIIGYSSKTTGEADGTNAEKEGQEQQKKIKPTDLENIYTYTDEKGDSYEIYIPPRNLEHPEAVAYVQAYEILKDYNDDYTQYTNDYTTKKAIEYYDMSLNNEFTLTNTAMWYRLADQYNDLCVIQVGGITKVLKRKEAEKVIKDTFKKRREILENSPTERDFTIDTWALTVEIPHLEKGLNEVYGNEKRKEDERKDKLKETVWNTR